MPVIDQINDASTRIFDLAETTNERAHEATIQLVSRLQDADLPLVDRLPKVNLPLVDRLPEPAEAVDATFDFVATGIDTNRAFAARVIGRFGDVEAEAAAPAPAAKKAAASKKAAPKKSAPKAKATASKAKTTAKKAPAKK